MRKIIKPLVGLGAAVAALAIGLAGPASAAPTYAEPQVGGVSDVTLDHQAGRAFITATYKCFGGRTGTHLWVSVKQGPRINVAKQHTESKYAKAWYDTNWNFANDPAGLTVNCNGHWTTSTFTLKPEFGQLKTGTGFVQFCLFDSTSGGSTDHGFAFSYTTQAVNET